MASHFFQRPLRLTTSVLKLCCLTHLTFTEFIQIAPSQGPSMVPTFTVQGDWILSDMTCRRGRGVGVGDVVMYRIPISDVNCGVKRIIGMPGDFVTLRNPQDLSGSQVIQIPKGHCWIEGDNLPVSRDSRHFGPLPLALIQGKVMAKILPWRERHWVANGLEPVDHRE